MGLEKALSLDTLNFIWYILLVRCKICQKEFIPNKYRPNQQVCSSLECQQRRQIENEKAWRTKNPDYFKCLGQDEAWRENRHRYSRLWKAVRSEHLKEYEKEQRGERRGYMRGYMREYRQAKNVNGHKS